MTTKFVEIRDRHTFVPALAFSIEGADHYLARRAGFHSRMIYLVILTAQQAAYDPWSWTGSRTFKVAHRWLEEHWDEFESGGGVVDVEFILGESPAPKVSEQETVPA